MRLAGRVLCNGTTFDWWTGCCGGLEAGIDACQMGGDILCGQRCVHAVPCFPAQVASNISWLHSSGMVHADLKPHNCLVKWSNSLKRFFASVADLGSMSVLPAMEDEVYCP
jgi:hypothetical protein